MNVAVESALEPEEQVWWRTWSRTVEIHSSDWKQGGLP